MPRPDPDVPLTPQQLADVRQRYAVLSDSGLQQAYTEALDVVGWTSAVAHRSQSTSSSGSGVEGVTRNQVEIRWPVPSSAVTALGGGPFTQLAAKVQPS